MRFAQGIMRLATTGMIAVAAVAIPATAYAAPVTPQMVICDASQTYKVTSRSADVLVQTIPTIQVYNKGTTTATFSEAVAITGTVSLSFTASITVEESVIVAGSKQTLGAGATITLSGSVTTTAGVTVTSHHYGYIYAGIWRGVTTGTYTKIDTHCKKTTGTVVARTPYRFGFIVDGN